MATTEETKLCRTCGEIKPIGLMTKDRSRNRCKSCAYAASKVWRSKNKEYLAKRYAQYVAANRDKMRARQARYDARRKLDPGFAKKSAERGRRYSLRYPDRHRARVILRRAVAAGRIIRPPCEVCGKPNAEGHHTDYSKPLDVRWLCFKHHAEVHGKFQFAGQA